MPSPRRHHLLPPQVQSFRESLKVRDRAPQPWPDIQTDSRPVHTARENTANGSQTKFAHQLQSATCQQAIQFDSTEHWQMRIICHRSHRKEISRSRTAKQPLQTICGGVRATIVQRMHPPSLRRNRDQCGSLESSLFWCRLYSGDVRRLRLMEAELIPTLEAPAPQTID